MSNGDESRIVKPGAFGLGKKPAASAMMDIGINPESVVKFKEQMREMREEAEALLKLVETVLAKAKELEAVKDAISD
jgi:hypothetical protein